MMTSKKAELNEEVVSLRVQNTMLIEQIHGLLKSHISSQRLWWRNTNEILIELVEEGLFREFWERIEKV